jgi:predicted small lipoprotein YifL
MRKRTPTLLTLLVLCLGLAACGTRRTEVYLWPPATDVADP